MNSRKSFIIKVSLILLLLLIMVVITGTYAYRQFTGVLEGISEQARPDSRLLTAEALQNDLQDAELSVKSFSLTGDTIFIDRFKSAKSRAFERLDLLYEVTHQSEASPIQLDSLEGLIGNKIQILDDLLLLHDNDELDSALTRVIQNAKNHISSTNDSNEHSFFNWLFRRDKNQNNIDSTVNQITIEELENHVNEVKEETAVIQTAIKSKELELIIKDRQINERIESMLNELRESELRSISHESKLAAETIERTKRQIAFFSIAIGLLVLFMAYIFMNYIRGSRRYRKAVSKAKSEAEDLAYTKERFLANMSHEMRTPMNAIWGFTEQIAQGPLSKDQKDQIGMVQKSADHLLYLINEILDFSKLQAKRLNLEIIGFKPKELIDDLKAFMRSSANKKDLHVSVELDEKIPDVLLGDPYRLRQILLNLISNSIKFTDEGGIQIKAEAEQTSENECVLKIEVIDTGIGMNEKQIKKVFKEFVQAETSTSRTYGGTGLGLAIVKMLVDLHSGRIKLTSEPKVGTCVELEIPYKIGSAKDLVVKDDHSQIDLSVDLEHLNVLIVDDELFNRKLLSNILTKHKASFKEASNGQEAIELAKKEQFDIILMDARMPEINGIEATKIIRSSDFKSSQTPIIALTAAVSEEDRITYKNAGMDGFLAKPYHEVELLRSIDEAVKVDSALKRAPQNVKTAKSSRQKNKNSILNFEQLESIAQDDHSFYIDMLETFIEGSEEAIQLMKESLSKKDWEGLADHAHKIASPAGHLGAKKLRDTLKQIENNCRKEKELTTIDEQVQKAIELSKMAIEEAKKEIAKNKNN